jgi:hypothetical protein
MFRSGYPSAPPPAEVPPPEPSPHAVTPSATATRRTSGLTAPRSLARLIQPTSLSSSAHDGREIWACSNCRARKDPVAVQGRVPRDGGERTHRSATACHQAGRSGLRRRCSSRPRPARACTPSAQVRRTRPLSSQLDVRTGELPASAYDLVTCRALLRQIAEDAPAVLARMAAAVKPADGCWSTSRISTSRRPRTPAAWTATWKALIDWGHANGVDWLIGRTLPSMVSKLGLGRPQAKTDVRNIRGRDRGALYFRLFSLRCAIVWLTVDGSTRQRSTPPQRCWRTRATGRSAG